ncbi:DUF3291 domain-containing protein [Fulvimarina sp. 2208YS6-2-32]|uniref:DUF3291 domain-containing protein n=1 Tax=Fulvimarina uroteuthidis TaxID=3098149 RepID=A0ABU5I2N7_9HYPH|nr:DUF3291 domain-containing protein [Fulvimarina sp. 2208YS6-2-32]MDY8109496.1 DUF3291 domain-containing protein [Fulvimarina sp. 2208YS6-2-32]
MHLAELNIAYPKYPLDDARMADFVDNLVRINTMASKMPGFVWINKDESGHAFAQQTPWPGAAANLTVWESVEQLEHFVWNTVHKRFYNRKNEWFETMTAHHFVMWWVPEGHRPSLLEAKAKLDLLQAEGDSDEAFTWAHLPHVKLWQSQRCG